MLTNDFDLLLLTALQAYMYDREWSANDARASWG